MTDLAEQHWDVIVIGTGIGGGTVGRCLSEAGLKVLFVEKGPAGYRSEETALSPDIFDPTARGIRGFWPAEMEARIDGRTSRFFGPLGAGVGGTSVFYAATLERPEPHDLDDLPDRPHPTGGWPICYADIAPYLDRAERIFCLSGTQDPLSQHQSHLRVPPQLSRGEAELMADMQVNGLSPYHLHSAIKHIEGCKPCLGFKCPKRCKMDGRSAGVEPALETENAALLDRAEVRRLNSTGETVTGIEVRHGGETKTLTADRIILAGGAFGSPRLLLASANDDWPDGLANQSGLVGRNLMFHLNELFALWPKRSAQFDGPSKSIGFRDLYHIDGHRLGMVQSMGVQARYGEIAWYLERMIEGSPLRHLPLATQFSRIPAALAARVLGHAQIFVGLLEDLPYKENCVLAADGDTINFTYRISDELRERRKVFRRQIKRSLAKQRMMFLGLAPELNYGHPCGTLRFGDDPQTSVLNSDCRAHGLLNLWVADASFMPTSAGVNPSLTIAANAIRVADQILKRGP